MDAEGVRFGGGSPLGIASVFAYVNNMFMLYWEAGR